MIQSVSGIENELGLVHSVDLIDRRVMGVHREESAALSKREWPCSQRSEPFGRDGRESRRRCTAWESLKDYGDWGFWLPPHCKDCEERVTRSSFWMLNTLRMVLGLPEKRAMMVKQS